MRALVDRRSCSVPQLDGIRAIAVLWVLASHCLHFMPIAAAWSADGSGKTARPPASYWVAAESWQLAPVAIGDTGVDLFLVLSGLLLGRKLGAELRRTGRIRHSHFWAARLARLWPAYMVALAIHAIATPAPCMAWGWANALMVNNLLGPQVSQGSSDPESPDAACMGHSWSVALEFQLSLAAPAMVWLMWHRSAARPCSSVPWWAWAAGLVAIGVAVRALVWTATPSFEDLETAMYDKPHTRYAPFVAGLAVARALESTPDAGAPAPRGAAAADTDRAERSQADGRDSRVSARAHSHERPFCGSTSDGLSASPTALFWAGSSVCVLMAWSASPGLLQPFWDRPGRSLAHGLVATLFRPLFGAAAGLSILGLLGDPHDRCERECPPRLIRPGGAGLAAAAFDHVGRLARSGRLVCSGVLAHPAWAPLARLGYGVYLLQFVPIVLLDVGGRPLPGDSVDRVLVRLAGLFGSSLASSALLAGVLFVAVERPCIELGRARGLRQVAAPTT